METCWTGLDSKDKVFPCVCMVVYFSASRPRDLGRDLMLLENPRVGDKVVSKAVYHRRAHVRVAEAGQAGFERNSAEYWLELFPVFSTWRDDFGTKTKDNNNEN